MSNNRAGHLYNKNVYKLIETGQVNKFKVNTNQLQLNIKFLLFRNQIIGQFNFTVSSQLLKLTSSNLNRYESLKRAVEINDCKKHDDYRLTGQTLF